MNSSAQGRQSANALVPTAGQLRACDPQRQARGEQDWKGVIEVASLERFASGLVDAEGPIQWLARFSIEPGLDGTARAWLTLELSIQTRIACGLCAEPLNLAIAEKRRFSFAADEDEASRLDEQANDHDVVVAEPQFDLLDLIEDELILALPVHAQHDNCPAAEAESGASPSLIDEGGSSGVQQTQRPFADLATQMRASNQTNKGSRQGRDAKNSAGKSGSESKNRR